jgi:Bacterial PH domain
VPSTEEQVAQAVSAKLDAGTRWLLRREIGNLAHLLPEGEEIVHMAQGRHGGATGLIVVTDRRLLFIEQGLSHRRVEDYPFAEIRSVQVDVSVVASELTITGFEGGAAISRVYPKDRTLQIADYVRTQTALPGEPGHALGRQPGQD